MELYQISLLSMAGIVLVTGTIAFFLMKKEEKQQIAIEFTRWLLEQEIVSINSDKKYLIPSYKDLFQEFLKTKQ